MPVRKRLLYASAACCLLAAFSSCDEDPPPPLVPATQGPTLAFAPDTLFFRVPGDSLMADLRVRKILEVWNGGTEILYWRASENVDWLTFSATHEGSSQGERDSVQVFAWFDQIPEGQTLEGDITVSAGDDSQTVRAIATNAMNGRVCVSTDSLAFAWESDPGPKTLQIRSCGGSRVPWAVSANAGWLELSPQSGESAGEWDDVAVAVDWSKITDTAARSGAIEVAGPADSVRVGVFAQPSQTLLCVDSTSLELDEDTRRGPVAFGVRNCGASAMDWSLSVDEPWALPWPTSGTGSGEWDTVQVWIRWPDVPHSEMETAILTVTAGGRRADVAINAHPRPPPVPALCVDRNGYVLDERANPGPVDFRVRNCGDWPLDWYASANRPWILLSPTSGTSSGEWDSVYVAIDWPNTPRYWDDPSAHSGRITVTAGQESYTLTVSIRNFCRIDIIEPTAGTSYLAGEMPDLIWTGRGMDHYVVVELLKGNQVVWRFGREYLPEWGLLRVPNSGRMTWMVSGYGFGPGSDYRFRVFGPCRGYSEYFTINEPPCYIAVTCPPYPWDAGWRVGYPGTITWDPSNAGATVSIELYKDDVFQGVIVPATENDGAYEWLVDDFGGGPGLYRVKITDTVDSNCTGMSDYFDL